MKTKYYKLILGALFLLISQVSYSQKRIAIYGQNNTSATNLQWANMTHYVYAFFNPMDNTGDMTDATGTPNALCGGSVWFTTGTFTTRIAAAKTANPNIKIIISTGGAPASDAGITTRLNTILASGVARAEMENDLCAFIKKYDLDGFDLDLEHPVSTTEKNNHETFLSEMKTKMNALESTMCKDLELSIALNGETDHFILTPTGSDYVNPGVNSSVDFFHLMTYDASYSSHNAVNSAWPLNHSPLIHAQEAVRDFSGPPFNWPLSKMVIGIPFYGKTGANGGGGTSLYSAINGANSLALYNADTDGTYGYNGCTTITSKVNYALTKGLAGVVVWEGSQDRASGYTLQGCIIAAMGTLPTTERTCCQKPGLGNDVVVCNTPFSITLNSGTTVGAGTYVWKRIAPTSATLSAAFTNTATITSGDGVGTYVVIRNETISGVVCSRSDTVVINATLLSPVLPATATLCASSYTLTPTNLTTFPSGTTWQWQLGGVNISGATSSSYYAAQPGTYKLLASLAGCTSTSATTVVSASSVVPVEACRTTAGTLTLSVSGGTGPYYWYSQDSPGGTVLAGGSNTSTYTTPSLLLPSTTYYYVEDRGSATNYSIGETAIPTGFANNVATAICMEFDVTSPLKIKSVDVYPYNNGVAGQYPCSFRIEIINDNNNVVFTSSTISWAGTQAGAFQTIQLDASLDIGKYRMRAVNMSGTSSLFHHGTSAFIYGTGNIKITREINVAQYGPFYNWQIADFNTCKRIKVRAVVSASCSEFLPVELTSFNASREGKSVLLDWSTATETNNDYFVIERSLDGINFSPIGTVNGNGNSSTAIAYQFVDVNAPDSKLYYRLAQYDLDAKMEYSKIKNVGALHNLDLTVAPNPFSNYTTVTVKGATSAYEIRVFDVSGRLVHTSVHNNENENITIGNNLNSGFYIMEVISDNATLQYKFVKE